MRCTRSSSVARSICRCNSARSACLTVSSSVHQPVADLCPRPRAIKSNNCTEQQLREALSKLMSSDPRLINTRKAGQLSFNITPKRSPTSFIELPTHTGSRSFRRFPLQGAMQRAVVRAERFHDSAGETMFEL
eukprot:4380327-Amphidinium_carterae.1